MGVRPNAATLADSLQEVVYPLAPSRETGLAFSFFFLDCYAVSFH